jgi:hypothetical protein
LAADYEISLRLCGLLLLSATIEKFPHFPGLSGEKIRIKLAVTLVAAGHQTKSKKESHRIKGMDQAGGFSCPTPRDELKKCTSLTERTPAG